MCIGPPHCQSVTITTLRSPPPPPLSANSMLSCYFNIFGHHTCGLSVPFIIIIVVRSSLSSSALLFTLQFYTLLVHDFTFLSLLYHSVAVLSSLFPLGVLFMLILLWSRLHPFYKPYPSAAFHIFFPRKMMSRKYLLTEAINVHFRTNRRPIERYIWYDIVKLKMLRHRCSDTNVSNHG